MRKMFEKKTNEKLEALGKVLEQFIFLYGLLMIFALIMSLFNGKTHIATEGMLQLAVYISIAAIGVIVCLTDIIFSKVSAKLRLIVYGSFIYVSSFAYFKDTAINPLQNTTNFLLYTGNFAVVCAFVIFMWTMHENSVKKNYDEMISAYQLERE